MSRWWRGEGRASTASHPAPPRVHNPLQVRGRGRGLRDRPSGNAHRSQPAVSRKSRERHGPAQGHTTTWDPLGPRWAPFPAPGPADQPQAPQRRVLPHGAAQQILPQGAVFRGQQALLSPGSPGMAPSPCRGGVMGQGLGLRGARAELQPHPASRSSGLGSRTCPACGALRGVPQAPPYSPRKRPVAKAAPSAAEPRASAAGTESRGAGWIMVRPGGSDVQVTWLGLLGPHWEPPALQSPPCPGAARGGEVSDAIWRPHSFTASPARTSLAPSGGCTRNCARRGALALHVVSGVSLPAPEVYGPGSGRRNLIPPPGYASYRCCFCWDPGAYVGGWLGPWYNKVVMSTT